MKIKIRAHKGIIVGNRDGFAQTLKNLDGLYMVTFMKLAKPKSTDEWRKYYFFLRDILFEDGETGYTKDELHNLAKEHLLNGDSTSVLTEEDWEKFIKE